MKFKRTEGDENFLKGLVYGFCQKIALFLIVVFERNQARKDRFFDILHRKGCFSDEKSKVINKFKKSKLSKAVSPWFLICVCLANRGRKDAVETGKVTF